MTVYYNNFFQEIFMIKIKNGKYSIMMKHLMIFDLLCFKLQNFQNQVMGVFRKHIDWILLKIQKNDKKITQLNFHLVYFYHEMGEQKKYMGYNTLIN